MGKKTKWTGKKQLDIEARKTINETINNPEYEPAVSTYSYPYLGPRRGETINISVNLPILRDSILNLRPLVFLNLLCLIKPYVLLLI